MNPIDLISAAPWTRVAFTTYALSLSFFEAVLLDALLRGGGRNALILADSEGIRAGLSEEGARRVGRDYEIEPVACTNHGVFHPKIGVLFHEDDAHLLVGSGNLTFAGWGGNLELIEHLHPSFAGDAFDETASFFEQLAQTNTIVTMAGAACEALAVGLRKAAQLAPRDGSVHVLHSLDGAIAEQLALYAEDLGGATGVTGISPYFDLRGEGLIQLATELGCNEIALHSHPTGTVRGQGANAWPFEGSNKWKSVHVEGVFHEDNRPLHAKSLEVICRKGRLLLTGSANLTHAGLFARNIEACVLRVQRNGKAYWISKPANPPVRSTLDDLADEEDDLRSGILSARLEGETIHGRVLTPRLSGEARVSLRSPRAIHALGNVLIHASGQFAISAPGVELESWENGRLILRLEQADRVWEGFVSIAAALALIRRTGAIAPRLMAMLAGTETPADVAAILAWFHEDPNRMPTSLDIGGGEPGGPNPAAEATFVTLADLKAAHIRASEASEEAGEGRSTWRHAMALIRAAFAQSRGPWGGGSGTDDDDDDDEARQTRLRSEEQADYRSLQLFDELLVTMLAPEAEGRHALMALSLAHFLADRIRPAPGKVQLWLDKILPQIRTFDGPEADMAVAAVLLHRRSDCRGDGAIRARRFFLRRGIDPATLVVEPLSIPAFIGLLSPGSDLVVFLVDVRSVRTMGEQIDAYLSACGGSRPTSGYDGLMQSPYWPKLKRALSDPQAFAKLMVIDSAAKSCPRCNIQLPITMIEDLRYTGLASCCGRILLNKDC